MTDSEMSQLPQHYADFTHLIDKCQAEACREAEDYALLLKQGLDGIDEKMDHLVWLESEVIECAGDLEKCVNHDIKSESSDQRRMLEEESRVMELAEALTFKHQLGKASEEAKRNLLDLKRVQASQLAEEIVAEQNRVRASAELRFNQLLVEEETAKQRVTQLTQSLFQSRRELNTKASLNRLAETAARKKVDDTVALQLGEQHELDKMDEQLLEIRTDADVADRLAEMRDEEEVDSGMLGWEKKPVMEGERAWANSLHEKQATSETALERQKVTLTERATALMEAEDTVQRCTQERRELKACAKKCFSAEQEALGRARNLVDEQGERRRAAQAVVSELTAEEQEARGHAFQFEHCSLTSVETTCEGGDNSQHKPYQIKKRQLDPMEEAKDEEGEVVGSSY